MNAPDVESHEHMPAGGWEWSAVFIQPLTETSYVQQPGSQVKSVSLKQTEGKQGHHPRPLARNSRVQSSDKFDGCSEQAKWSRDSWRGRWVAGDSSITTAGSAHICHWEL